MPEHFTPPHYHLSWSRNAGVSLDGGREFGSPASIQLSLKSFSFAALQRHHVLSASLFLPATDLRNRVMDVTMPFMEYLDQEQLVCLKWGFDNPAGDITFQLAVNTTGWVGFGLSPNGDMKGSDIVIGGVGSSGSYFSVSYEIIINEQLLYFYLFSINSWKLSSSFILFNLILCFGFLFSFISVVLVWILLKIINFCLVFRFA